MFSSFLSVLYTMCISSNMSQLVGLGGLEPPTSRLSGVRSNQLSYRPVMCWLSPLYGFMVETRRFELLTPCLQGRCSPN